MKKRKTTSKTQSSAEAMPGSEPKALGGGPPIVGIGASAGGLDAFARLLRHIAPDSGLAFVLVQHLDPTHESLLPELLARQAPIPVLQVTDGMPMEPDHVYVIPPNATMTVTDGHLHLVPRPKSRAPHTPVDDFLRSLAQIHRSQSLGVILSGAGSDGALGIEAIKAEGGITMAQEVASAAYSSMPQHAIDSGHVDFVLPPEKIGDQLNKIGRHITAQQTRDGSLSAVPAEEQDDVQRILLMLQRRRGVDFRQYRRGTIERRILRRMLMHQHDTHQDYVEHLAAQPTELDALFEDLLIGVTTFFRDPDAFAALQEKGFPELMRGRKANAPVRVWVVGCSSGEEAYSMAIALLEFLGDTALETPVQIFATDLSETALAKARSGRYPASIGDTVSAQRLQRFFVREEGGYRIAKAIRDLCVFSKQNVVRDPPFSHLDFISCRNVLIYLEPKLQKRVFPIFHYALNPGGLLLLGTAESVGPSSEFFSALDKGNRIFRRAPAAVRRLDMELAPPPLDGESLVPNVNRAGPSLDGVEGEVDRLLLDRFAPAGVVINEQLEIVQFRGQTGDFLQHAPGMASLSLLKLARQELITPLRRAIRRATADGRAAREAKVLVRDGDDVRHVSVEVLPIRPVYSEGRFFVVAFEVERTVSASPADTEQASAPARKRPSSTRAESRELRELRSDLAATTQYLQDLSEEYEATNEELRAANEEIQSSNEELQSTNEELETTKEEIQSANEELTTVNDELRHRNQELSSLSSDLANVLANTQVPIMIVGGDLRLRRFTPAAERVMRVIATDAGRPLGDIKLRVDVPDIERRILSSIETLTTSDEDVRDEAGRWWAMTIRPYQTVERKIDGAVVVFTDIDASKRFGERAEEASEVRRKLLEVSEAARVEADRASEAAQAANRAKSLFLASMSHDLRAPLQAIMSFLDLLELELRGAANESKHADFAVIRQTALHLLSLINDILGFAKLESGRVEFHVTDVSLTEVLDELEEIVKPLVREKSLGYARRDCDVVVRADADKLRQIMLNLVTNAVKYTRPGGRIDISCDSSAVSTRIDITDTGIGIPPNEVERIFEPFVQVNRSLRSPGSEGVGLGLAISRDLARRMGGDLTVESTVGRGSRFSLTVPTREQRLLESSLETARART